MCRTFRFFAVAAASACFALLSGCASKRAMVITAVGDAADTKFELANDALVAGKFEQAGQLLCDVYTMAFSIDDADLLCRTALSGVSYKIATGNLGAVKGGEPSFISSSADLILSDARRFASASARPEALSAVCDIFGVRLSLASGKKSYRAYADTLRSLEKKLQKEPFYLAVLHRTVGDVLVSAKDYDSAASSFVEAAKIHTKNRYLVEIGTDWYGAARAYSLGGKKDEAVSAIRSALKYDRDAENTSAIASDYFAWAKILVKGKPTPAERKEARALAEWASSVFRSGGFVPDAEACEKFAASLG